MNKYIYIMKKHFYLLMTFLMLRRKILKPVCYVDFKIWVGQVYNHVLDNTKLACNLPKYWIGWEVQLQYDTYYHCDCNRIRLTNKHHWFRKDDKPLTEPVKALSNYWCTYASVGLAELNVFQFTVLCIFMRLGHNMAEELSPYRIALAFKWD